MKFYPVKIRVKVFLITLVVVGCFYVLGRFIDSLFGTHPLGITIAVIISFPLNAYILNRYFKNYFARRENPKS